MTQPDLFDQPSTFTRTGTSIVPPTREECSRRKRDSGIQRAADHASAIDPLWRERALGYVLEHAAGHAEFMAEEVRELAERDGLACPTDPRAWGAVMVAAAKLGIINRIGYAPANSSNRSPKCLWGRA